jgi:hypothetical protein
VSNSLSQFLSAAAFAVLSVVAQPAISGQVNTAELVPGDVTVGENLQEKAMATLNRAPLDRDLDITLKSDDPSRLLLSTDGDRAGSPAIVIKLKASARQTGEFYLQGRGKSGTVTYTASAPGLTSGKGTVTLAPSGIIVLGPFRSPAILAATNSTKAITVYSTVLDSAMKPTARQEVAGGRTVTTTVTSSNPAVGNIAVPAVTIAGGSMSASTELQLGAAGETTVSVNVPLGFSTPAANTTVAAKVVVPAVAITTDEYVGKNLQMPGTALIGEPRSTDLTVTLTSSDPSRLILSTKATEKGSGSIQITIPAGQGGGTYYIQALADSGSVTYTASAPGFRTRTGTIVLAPSGVVVLGPVPFTRGGGPYPNAFLTSASEGKPVPLDIYTVYVNPVTKKSGDVTIQPLRPGLSLNVVLQNSDPTVGKVTSPIVMKGTTSAAKGEFVPLKAGQTVLSVVTPPDFAGSPNASSLTAMVKP